LPSALPAGPESFDGQQLVRFQRDGLTGRVVHDDRAVGACFSHLAFLDQLAPLPHVHVVGEALLESDVVPLQRARDLFDDVLAIGPAGLVFDDRVLGAHVGDFAERAHQLASDLEAEK